MTKEEYHRILPKLRDRLYTLQGEAYKRRIPVMIVFEGWSAAGKGGAIGTLAGRLDPRGLRVVAVHSPHENELSYPWMWRFWQKIPAYGQIVIFDTSWYRRVLIERVAKKVRKREWHGAFRDIGEFERQLAADGTVIIKFWLDISRKEQAKRFKHLQDDKLTAWQVGPDDLLQQQMHGKWKKAVDEMLAKTSFSAAPWRVIDAVDKQYVKAEVFRQIIAALEKRIGKPPRKRVAA